MSETKTDPIVEQVVKKFQDRSKVGIKKYGTTLAENKEGFIPFFEPSSGGVDGCNFIY